MSLLNVPAGAKAPDVFNVIIEIPANADPIKYEIDHETGAVFVDRFMGTSMHYPCNYGYVPQTIAADGDPVDVLVVTPFPLQPGVVIPCRPLGILKMEDEAGGDSKLVAVPTEKICAMYKGIQSMEDLPELLVSQIKHFFEHYKDLEPGKWVKVVGWDGIEAAKDEVRTGLKAFADKGFADASMDALTADVGLTRGALYHNFGDKRGLFAAVVNQIDSDMAERAKALRVVEA